MSNFFDTLVRDADYIKKNLVVMEDDSLVVKEDTRIYVPAVYEKRGLLFNSDTPSIGGIFAFVVNGRYAINNVPVLMSITPSEVDKTVIDDEEYYCYVFYAGDVMMPSIDVIVDKNIPNKFWKLFYTQDGPPAFMQYEDLCQVMDNSPKYAGVKFSGVDNYMFAVMSTYVYRNKIKPTQYYRQIYDGVKWAKTNKPRIVSFNDVKFGANNTTAKLIGGYLDDGIDSALLNKSTKVEPLEAVLRR